MNEKTMQLLQLVKENPDLPIIPLVDYEVVWEDYGYWVGEFSYCYVGEYALFHGRFYDDKEEFKEDYYNCYEAKIKRRFNYNLLQEAKYLDERVNDFFKKAIIVYIDYVLSPKLKPQ